MIKRAPRLSRNRTRLAPGFAPSIPAVAWTATINAAKARITTTLPCVIRGLPLGITVQGVAPTAVTQISATVFDLTYAANVVATNVLLVAANVPQIRGQAGGFLNSGTITF